MKAKDTLMFLSIQNPILVRKVWFWHTASHITKLKDKLIFLK